MPPSNACIEDLAHMVRTRGAMLPERTFVPLLVKGTDALDLLHRISTNDLSRIKPWEPRRTVFTTEKGRIVDLVDVVQTGEGLCLITHAAASPGLRAWIERYIITEDVEVVDLSLSKSVLCVMTGDLNSRALGHAHHDAGEGDMHPGGTGSWRTEFGPLTMRCRLVPTDAVQGLRAAWIQAGGVCLADEVYHEVRVAAGVPSFPEELNDAHNPLEAGLRGSISFTKGCYIGQEVIARLDSYKKVQRELVVMTAAAVGARIAPSMALESAGNVVGSVTSRGGMIRESGKSMLFGYIEKSARDERAQLRVQLEDGSVEIEVFEAFAAPWWTGSMPA
jgi:tRNA-modifying protein YgfZ